MDGMDGMNGMDGWMDEGVQSLFPTFFFGLCFLFFFGWMDCYSPFVLMALPHCLPCSLPSQSCAARRVRHQGGGESTVATLSLHSSGRPRHVNVQVGRCLECAGTAVQVLRKCGTRVTSTSLQTSCLHNFTQGLLVSVVVHDSPVFNDFVPSSSHNII